MLHLATCRLLVLNIFNRPRNFAHRRTIAQNAIPNASDLIKIGQMLAYMNNISLICNIICFR